MKSILIDAMAAAGLQPYKPIDLIPNGKILRFRLEGDKAGSRNGWAVGNDGPIQFWTFGSWKTGATHTWHEATTSKTTPAERAALQVQMRAAQAARAAELAKVQTYARQRAAKLWATARPATNAHAYLQRKAVHAYGIRQLRDVLVIPARDVHGELHTLQFIDVDGSKRYLTGGRLSGCYFAIGRPADSLLIAEGYATAATLYQATGRAVAVCFSCGNMEAVARALRQKFPKLRLIICGDDDRHTPGNPGLTHARTAANAVGGYLAVPVFAGGA